MKRWLWVGLLGSLLMILVGCGTQKVEEAKQDIQPTPKVTYTEMVVPKGIPVLMYHKIGPDKDNDAVLREDLFKAQMKFLKDNEYHPLTMDQLYAYVTKGERVPVRPVVLTFDDGYPDTYSIVMPTLKEYGFPAVVFVNPGDIGTRLTWQQLKEMQQSGLTIASHGYLHEDMAAMSKEAQYHNIKNAQDSLHRNLGITNEWFCYPYGKFTEDTEKLAQKEGIKMAMAMNPGWAHKGDNPLAIKRVWIGNAVDLTHFKQRITTEHYDDL